MKEELTLRDYFAVHAPDDIPGWFEATLSPATMPPMPRWQDLDKVHQNTALSWINDGCFDLPNELEWFGKQVIRHREAHVQESQRRMHARYFQWRWHYADRMLAWREAS